MVALDLRESRGGEGAEEVKEETQKKIQPNRMNIRRPQGQSPLLSSPSLSLYFLSLDSTFSL